MTASHVHQHLLHQSVRGFPLLRCNWSHQRRVCHRARTQRICKHTRVSALTRSTRTFAAKPPLGELRKRGHPVRSLLTPGRVWTSRHPLLLWSAGNSVPGAKYETSAGSIGTHGHGSVGFRPHWDRPDVRDYLGSELVSVGKGQRPSAGHGAFGSRVPRSKPHIPTARDFSAPGQEVGLFHVSGRAL